MVDTVRTLDDAAALLRPGMTAFIHGTATEPRAFVERLAARPGALEGVHLITSFIPGINTETLTGTGARITSFMAQPALADAIAAGGAEALRLCYGALPGWFSALERLDLAFVRGRRLGDGRVSTGLTGELIGAACARAARVCVLDDRAMPVPERGIALPAERADHVVISEGPLVEYRGADRIDDTARAIARNVASLVGDGATLQAGLGVVPTAVFAELAGRRGLRVFSGMACDALVTLAEAGALDAGAEHVYGMALGSTELYRWLDGRPGFRVAGCEETHDRAVLAALPRFTAINSAIEVGLDGAINAEWLGPRAISGPGGLPDYAAGGAASAGGRSIIALPSANAKRGISRIVPRVANADAPTVEAGVVTHVVTEHGVAEIGGVDGAERARRLIGVADPAHRATLAEAAALSH